MNLLFQQPSSNPAVVTISFRDAASSVGLFVEPVGSDHILLLIVNVLDA